MQTQISQMPDVDLLALLCGRDAARVLAKRSLAELFGLRPPRQGDLLVAEEERNHYTAHPQIAAAKELYLRALHEQMGAAGIEFTSPGSVKEFLCGRLGNLEHEVFWCLWLDAQNRLICGEEVFRGTLTQTSVYPREIVKLAIKHNAAALICAHNHPSGIQEPSRADELLTTHLKSTLVCIDVRLLDHIIVAGNQTTSLSERGLL